MMQIIPAVLALSALAALTVIAVRLLRHKELERELAAAQWQSRYFQQETELALSVSRSLANNAANRLMQVFGNDYLDYLIARQMRLPPQTDNDSAAFAVHYGDGRSVLLKDGKTYIEQESGTPAPEPPADPVRPHTRAARFQRRPYTPPQHWPPMPQCPAPQPNGLTYWDNGDDDVLDITPIVYPPALLPAQAEPQTPPPAGRQRQYASNAEKQAAYCQRQKQRRAAQRGA